ncbi:MAG: flagellar biosynthesis protein FlhA [Roseovarius sp.]|uniref:flagellar biosynthesis protein FlhA n=1 Tax=Roseovarius sp. TaxID=1486281 RepID=UPI001B5FD64D|nr:flagellar biosynthesis protein FlhA [Roseovarius sp.]MBQ0751490.1 flagellar biosynthesis protein FlhA [Roseovarius sp.]MBQ0809065.1 flagellar biosynthesis protein FlhA [Roseovarius sp.]
MAALSRASYRPQLGAGLLPVGILAVVAMMVLPLPLMLLDIFFVFNILLSLLVLMVALYSYRPLDFSSFPSVLLIATVFRLALNVASTRIVLTSGHEGSGAAGKVIEAFGNFVIAGNFAVGLVVFVILVIINLMVITKGAGRVSEVSARFTLDAMPGKQMAIDADLNAGILTPEQARARRAEVGEEADFYGAMDGASKFVKGDAIAGILILAANILGGIVIGTAQHGLSLGQAAETYVLLSIGDGLVAQIPSLLLSIATAVIVTRVASAKDMTGHIGSQIGMHRAWLPVAAVMAIMGLIPGMPNLLFIVAALASGGVAWATRNQLAPGETAAPAAPGQPPRRAALPAPSGASNGQPGARPDTSGAITAEDVTDYAPITIQIGFGLIPLIEEGAGGALVSRITGIRREVSTAMGFVIPGVRIRDDMGLPANAYRIRIRQAIVAEDAAYPDRKLALPGGGTTRKLRGIEVKDPSFGMDAVWIQPHQQTEAEADDYVVVEPASVVATHLSQMLYAHAADLLGADDVQGLLDNLERSAPTLVESVVPKLVPLHVLTAVLRALLRERMPIADLPRILEDLAGMSARISEPQDMAEALRPALAPQLLQQIAPLKESLHLITLAPDLEDLLTRSQHDTAGLIVEQGLTRQILGQLNEAQESLAGQGRQAVVVVSAALRRAFAAFLRTHGVDAIVMAVSELPDNRRVEIAASIGGARPTPPKPSK